MSGSPGAPIIVDPSLLTTAQLSVALGIAALFAFVIAFVQIISESKKGWRACLTLQSFLYFLLLLAGDVTATLLASTQVVKLPSGLAAFFPYFAAFFGVFGFEVVLKNTNITIFDKGVLTIQAWIDKALATAAAAVIENDAKARVQRQMRLANKLAKVAEPQLNAFVSQTAKLNVEDLNAAAGREKADKKFYKALAAVAAVSSDTVEAFLLREEK